MDNDSHLIFESYRFKRIKEDAVESEDLPTRSHEIIAAIMPKDININGKKNENEFFNKAFPYVAKIIFDGNERKAQRYMYYDEDFNSDLISTYSYFQKNGFPKLRERDVERINRKMHGNVEEKPQQYAKDMEKDYTSQKISGEDAEKKDPREDHKEENAEKYVYTDIEVAFNIGGNEYIAYGDVHFGEEGLHGKEEDTVENFAVIDAKTRQEVQDEGILKHGYNAIYNAGVNKSAEENQEKDDEEGDLMTIMKQKGMIPQGAGTGTGKYGHHREEEEGICIEDLAKKFGVELSRMQDELEKGIKVEMEHTSDFAVATKIALDHLSEDPKYYIKLAKMKNSENEERRLDSSCWKGYHKQGTKLKGGVRVNNCVKNS